MSKYWDLDLNPTKSEHPPLVTPSILSLPSRNPPKTQTIPKVPSSKDPRLSVEDSAFNVVSIGVVFFEKILRNPYHQNFFSLYIILSYHILNMLLKHPILFRDAESLENVQKLALKFVKGL